jgi:hypothetical protein
METNPIQLFTIPAPPPWEAFLLRVSRFPMPRSEVLPVAQFLRHLINKLELQWSLRSEVFLQLEQLGDSDGRAQYSEHAPQWIPEVGLGVWPNRKPPAKWSREEFMETGPEEKLRALMFQAFRITGPEPSRENARDTMLHFGSVIQIMTATTPDAFFRETKKLFLGIIKDPTYRCFPFYVPLLDGESLQNATLEELKIWFGGARVYIRESFEDQGILIASCESLDTVLKDLGGRFDGGTKSAWQFPV